MANFLSLPFWLLSLLLLPSLIMADAGGGGGGEGQLAEAELFAVCPSLDPYRAGVSNKNCCRAIAHGIDYQGCGCGCVCKVLINYKAATLITSCSKTSWCPRCEHCVCSTNPSPLRRTVG